MRKKGQIGQIITSVPVLYLIAFLMILFIVLTFWFAFRLDQKQSYVSPSFNDLKDSPLFDKVTVNLHHEQKELFVIDFYIDLYKHDHLPPDLIEYDPDLIEYEIGKKFIEHDLDGYCFYFYEGIFGKPSRVGGKWPSLSFRPVYMAYLNKNNHHFLFHSMPLNRRQIEKIGFPGYPENVEILNWPGFPFDDYNFIKSYIEQNKLTFLSFDLDKGRFGSYYYYGECLGKEDELLWDKYISRDEEVMPLL